MSNLTIPSLRRFNLIAGIVHLLQMIAVIALSTDFSLPVNATYMAGPPGSTFATPVRLFDTPLALAVALFLGLSALAHFIVASPQFFDRYAIRPQLASIITTEVSTQTMREDTDLVLRCFR